ncbi:MAG: adenylate/guanylate cyclase domain-containing protein [Desulfosalsimonadaceae bacterium]
MIKSVKLQLALLLLLPAALLLVVAGATGFVYARSLLIEQWRQSAILKLERAAHHIDMRLGRPADWMSILHETASFRSAGDDAPVSFILKRLENLEGVADVSLTWTDSETPHRHRMDQGESTGGDRGSSHRRAVISAVAAPRYNPEIQGETVSLISEILDRQGRIIGVLEVSVRFDYLMQDIEALGWWQSQVACLVDESGRYLAHSGPMEKGRTKLGETDDPVELAVLRRMQEESHGTYLGEGYPPETVSGFYRLEQVPWVLILYAPGREILAPVVDFRFYYTIAAAVCIGLILLLIQVVGGGMARRIGNISAASEKVSKGEYVAPLPVMAADEIGQLEASFNAMVEGLRERDFIRDTFGRYMDKDIAKEIMKRPEAASLGGQKRKVAILVSDIRGFSGISESLSPEGTIRLLNNYFSRMIDVIQKHKGIIVDFYGDGILVFFDPYEGPVAPAVGNAVRCGLEMRENMKFFREELKASGMPPLEIGIGIHAGEVVVGNIGSRTRAKYGIVGAAVNTASRICEKAKGGEVILSKEAGGFVNGNLDIKQRFTTVLKGIQEEMMLYLI